jgi:polyhydroxyalkanoate synthesis regulator phasin
MTTEREERIDDAVSKGGLLISELLKDGPITAGQARTIVLAVVRSAVPNFQEFEVRESAKRAVEDLNVGGGHADQSR